MLMTDAAPSASASVAALSDTIDSSRQIGVRRCRASVAWSTMSSSCSGCSISSRSNRSSSASVSMSASVYAEFASTCSGMRAERVAHGGGLGDVAAGLDLDLDAHVPLVEVAADDLDERRGVALDADRDARRHAVAHGAEVLAERAPLGAQRRVEHRELEAGLRHAVADERARGSPATSSGASVRRSSSAGMSQRSGDIPRALRVLARVERRLAGDDLAPARRRRR